jgi:hypothetical protein
MQPKITDEHRGGGTVSLTATFAPGTTPEQAEAWWFGRYHPAGYGSTTRVLSNGPGGLQVRCYRGTSCD